MPRPERLLIVRLRNWVGDVVLSVPTLQRLHDAGYSLQLLGKAWASDLLAGHGWPVQPVATGLRGRVVQLKGLREKAQAADPGFAARCNAVAFPYSFSSALDMRLAGLKAIGYAHEGRSLLLHRAPKRPAVNHELCVYWHLGSQLLGMPAEPPQRIALALSPQHLEQAAAIKRQHGIGPGYVVICPFAGGTWDKQPKTWPLFAAFAADVLPRLGRRVLICPGPGGEEAMARQQFGGATLLAGVGLGAYAALLKDAALMISNDTGPGHMAAAVGTPLVSVLGPTEPEAWRAWGPTVSLLRHWPQWPTLEQAQAAVAAALSTP